MFIKETPIEDDKKINVIKNAFFLNLMKTYMRNAKEIIPIGRR